MINYLCRFIITYLKSIDNVDFMPKYFFLFISLSDGLLIQHYQQFLNIHNIFSKSYSRSCFAYRGKTASKNKNEKIDCYGN